MVTARPDAASAVDRTPFVTVHLWGVPTSGVAGAVRRMLTHRRQLRRTDGLSFAKLLGTGSGRTFTPGDADPHHWGVLACWSSPAAAAGFEAGPVVRSWDSIATERLRLALRPLSARGTWAGRQPFGQPAARATGPVVAITRARLTTRRTAMFWRAVPPVVADLHAHPGLRLAVGIGEAPVGLQGTLSLWRDDAALTDFAYAGQAHTEVVRRTATAGWYAEELFARFAVDEMDGCYQGRRP
ncbi:MAG: Spheroidene monooxygenase [uncultured Nocardioidaceae bacterium]|uniref:Spheroidene monooxygenase n=1 Tax=uncultured Nocardioidaceae bacterium TaxID=253824 RepID=A0A6J4LZC1_9ACTN|nr:MAG: Spheroidene monooxygenase [uncultured Nocardioidaceae bacterium]